MVVVCSGKETGFSPLFVVSDIHFTLSNYHNSLVL